MHGLGVGTIEDETFEHFCERSPEWVKSGSALGSKLKFRIDKTKETKLRLNKRGAMNYSTPIELK